MLKFNIVSGGQTGVDRAALDAALEFGVPCGGWCPRGRRAEDGPLPDRYPLVETPAQDYNQRTEWNVRDSDATLILSPTPLTGGTLYTANAARRLNRPWRIADPYSPVAADTLAWIAHYRVLNIAGPRENPRPGIYRAAKEWIRAMLAEH